MEFLKEAYKKARKRKARIIFVEAEDKRVKEAVRIIEKRKIALPVVLNNGSLDERLNEAILMLKQEKADGLIAGCLLGTSKVARASFNFKEGLVSGNMLMLKDKFFIFADVSVIPEPNEEQLAIIADNAAKLGKKLGITPRIAMLSFSTNKSASHESVEKVRKAVEIAKKMGLNADGEMQADAALVKWIGKAKFPESRIAGDANILVFPDLNAGNIAYKLVERLAGYRAIGPILSNLKKPVNILSKGCDVKDIVDLAAITSLEC